MNIFRGEQERPVRPERPERPERPVRVKATGTFLVQVRSPERKWKPVKIYLQCSTGLCLIYLPSNQSLLRNFWMTR